MLTPKTRVKAHAGRKCLTPLLLFCLLTAFVGLFASLPAHARIVSEVIVRGAQFIPEEDIRATCGAETGIEYLEFELRAIEECLISTGVFETVTLTRQGDTLFIDVQELNTRPGRIDATLAYVSQDGITGSLDFERYNLFPQTYGAVSLEYGAEIQRLGVNLYRTEAFGTALDFGLELAGGRSQYEDQSFTHETLRAEGYFAWAPSDRFRLEVGLGFRDHALRDVSPGSSALLVREQTNGIAAPFARFSLTHVSLPKPAQEEEAWRQMVYSVSLDQYVWNIGTSDQIMDTRLEGRLQVPLAPRLRFLIGVEGGTVSGARGNATRTIDRFFPGADTFRGFAPRGIGPRDGDDFLGGNHFAKASLELQHEIGKNSRVPMRVGVFVDTGASWGLDDTLSGGIDDRFHRRSSAGLSLTFDVGKTPVSLYLAEPFQHEAGDKLQVFGLSVSTRF